MRWRRLFLSFALALGLAVDAQAIRRRCSGKVAQLSKFALPLPSSTLSALPTAKAKKLERDILRADLPADLAVLVLNYIHLRTITEASPKIYRYDENEALLRLNDPEVQEQTGLQIENLRPGVPATPSVRYGSMSLYAVLRRISDRGELNKVFRILIEHTEEKSELLDFLIDADVIDPGIPRKLARDIIHEEFAPLENSDGTTVFFQFEIAERSRSAIAALGKYGDEQDVDWMEKTLSRPGLGMLAWNEISEAYRERLEDQPERIAAFVLTRMKILIDLLNRSRISDISFRDLVLQHSPLLTSETFTAAVNYSNENGYLFPARILLDAPYQFKKITNFDGAFQFDAKLAAPVVHLVIEELERLASSEKDSQTAGVFTLREANILSAFASAEDRTRIRAIAVRLFDYPSADPTIIDELIRAKLLQ